MDSDVDTEKALCNLVVECPELRELERLLGNFNLFRVLGFEDGEIRHSNVLAWLLTPHESHGLRDLVLRRFLMQVINDCEETPDHFDPVSIDSADFQRVEVRREWQHIDLLIRIQTHDGEWVVAIENKVNSSQHSNQLTRYREIVEQAFPDPVRKLFILLSKNQEEPEDDAYIKASYDQIHQVLKLTFEEQHRAIGEEPLVLIRNYITLLEERFMENSRIAELANNIYRSHKHALDVIFEHRPDESKMLCDRLTEKLSTFDGPFQLIPMPSNKSYFRFIPDLWNHPKNRAGNAWGVDGAYVLIEVPLGQSTVVFKIIGGKLPPDWKQWLWEKCQNLPFRKVVQSSKPGATYMTAYSTSTRIVQKDIQMDDVDELADKVWSWIEEQLLDKDFLKCVEIIQEKFDDLPDPGA